MRRGGSERPRRVNVLDRLALDQDAEALAQISEAELDAEMAHLGLDNRGADNPTARQPAAVGRRRVERPRSDVVLARSPRTRRWRRSASSARCNTMRRGTRDPSTSGSTRRSRPTAPHRALFVWLKAEAVRRGYGTKKFRKVQFVADGADVLWNLQKEFFPDAEVCLDRVHAVEKLWACGKAINRGSRTKRAPLEAWVHEQKRRLRRGQLKDVIATLHTALDGTAATGPGNKYRREVLRLRPHDHQRSALQALGAGAAGRQRAILTPRLSARSRCPGPRARRRRA